MRLFWEGCECCLKYKYRESIVVIVRDSDLAPHSLQIYNKHIVTGQPTRIYSDDQLSSLIHSTMLKQHVRGFLSSSLLALLILTIPLMLWKALTIITGSPHPIVVVISQSMAPAFNRGDLLFLWNRQPWITAGEIPVCWFPGSPLPMVHRAIKAITLDGMRYDYRISRNTHHS